MALLIESFKGKLEGIHLAAGSRNSRPKCCSECSRIRDVIIAQVLEILGLIQDPRAYMVQLRATEIGGIAPLANRTILLECLNWLTLVDYLSLRIEAYDKASRGNRIAEGALIRVIVLRCNKHACSGSNDCYRPLN